MQLQSKQQKEKNHENSSNHSLSKEVHIISRKNLSVNDKMDLLTACIERIKSSKDAKTIKKSNDSKSSSNLKQNHEIKLKSNNKTEALVDKNVVVKEKKKRGRKKKIP